MQYLRLNMSYQELVELRKTFKTYTLDKIDLILILYVLLVNEYQA